ncbi:MAG: protein translocase subunit SecD [Clostridiales bacterium]|nr:protein translocase subunit SecD [Clostridiales bacterium]
MDNNRSLTGEGSSVKPLDAPPTHKAVKKKSTITKIVLMGVLLVVGMIFCFVPMKFGLTDYHPFLSKESISLGLDLEGGVYAVYDVPNYTEIDNFESKINGTRSSLEAMLVGKGFTEATVVREGENRLRVEIPDVENASDILDIIGDPVQLEFVLDSDLNTPVLTGDDVVRADYSYSAENGYYVQLTLTPTGNTKIAEITSANIGEYMRIYTTRNGVRDDNYISRAEIKSAIPRDPIITGNFTEEQAEDLANQINSGTFSVQLNLIQSETISPTLGENALTYGLIAGLIGFILVIAFMCFLYRMLGLAATLALLFYVVLYMFFLAVLPWVQLTLPGIAGILLSIGMAVDANIIIFERIKDEYRNGKSIMAAYHAGFKKALFAILDSNVTTVIACILLLLLGTGSVSGFALTLLVGVLLSLFTSLVVSRAITHWFINLNSHNEKLYNLKRGRQYQNLEADATDAAVLQVLQQEEEQKRQEKEEKQKLKELERNAHAAHRAKETGGEA